MARLGNNDFQSKPATDWETAPAVLGNQYTIGNGAWSLGQVKLREWLADTEKTIICPGVYDGLTARVALAQGFGCLHLSNAATKIARTGLTDSALPPLDFVLQLAQTIRQIDKVVPLIVEVDSSLGIEAVKAAVTRSHQADVSAVLLDDRLPCQCSKKDQAKNGAIGKVYLDRIQAAADQRMCIGSDIVIIARTNILVSCGCSKCFSDAHARLQQAADVGADVVFMAGGPDPRELEKITRHTFRNTPMMNAPYRSTTGQKMGRGVKIICYPDLFTHALYRGASNIVRGFHGTGEIGSMSTLPKPDDAGDMGGLRDLLTGAEPLGIDVGAALGGHCWKP